MGLVVDVGHSRSKSTTKNSGQYLPALTSARFFAALLVVIGHFFIIWRPGVLVASEVGSARTIIRTAIYNIVDSGFEGVSFFFLLSGFILVYTYTNEVGYIKESWKAYCVARFARIYPAYLFAFLLAIPPFFWSAHDPISESVRIAGITLLLFQAWVPSIIHVLNGPGWSLSDEAFFYAVFPLLVLLLAKANRKQALLIVEGAWLLTILIPIAFLVGAHFGWYPQSNEYGYIIQYPLARLPEFAMGIGLGRCFILTRNDPSVARWRKVKPDLLTLLAIAGLGVGLVLTHEFPLATRTNGLLDPFCALLIYQLAKNRCRIAALLSSPILVKMGEISYAMYILHWPLWDWMNRFIKFPSTGDLMINGLLCCFYVIVLIGLSLGVQRYIEQPARRVIRQIVAGNKQATLSQSKSL